MFGLTSPPQPKKSPAHGRVFNLKAQKGDLEAGVTFILKLLVCFYSVFLTRTIILALSTPYRTLFKISTRSPKETL